MAAAFASRPVTGVLSAPFTNFSDIKSRSTRPAIHSPSGAPADLYSERMTSGGQTPLSMASAAERHARWFVALAVVCAALLIDAAVVSAQRQTDQHDAHPSASDRQPPHEMHGRDMPMDDPASSSRDASGTAWLPDETPMYAVHRQLRGWMLMAHGNAFVQYLRDSGDRGSDQVGSINWIMGAAERSIGGARLTLRSMISAEPWTIRGCGYPDLLATGELCAGEPIHDRQHPHDAVMELAAIYERPLARGLRLQLYGGPAGEPAIGPVAFPHRVSALSNPLAPIGHHLFDATHIAYGVVTAGLYDDRWKVESSLFNGREPDEHRANIDLDVLDSWSGRVWFLPSRRWALQLSAARLRDAEAAHDGGERIDVNRTTASATYHRPMGPASVWASTIGVGHNAEHGGDATTALLLETSVAVAQRQVWYGRVELARKSGHDLDLDDRALFTVAKLQGGYTRYFAARNGWQPGAGGALSAGIVPPALEAVYGSRTNPGFAVYLTVRAAQMEMSKH